MSKRIIIQSVLFKDGLVVTVEESASAEEISVAVLEAVPQEHRSADLQIFDEADDDLETREFGDCEELRRGHVVHVGHCLVVDVVVRYAGRVADRRFPPATRVGRILRWAVHKLGISAASASEHARTLRGAGLLVTERAGKAVLHSRTPLGDRLLGVAGDERSREEPRRREIG